MSARCSSCRYPLSVCDSVVCHECWSRFHIDCAQSVGFPLFVLSGEPAKNTFHCSTCQLLPLPVARDDSDDEDMPSRQLDYALEGDTDLGKEMNEMKGGIQDLSDLCKDMLREINDLKSINLTLRCCVENLRHDNEQRDAVISELKLRLDMLEGKYFGKQPTDVTDLILDTPREEEKSTEIFTPSELECIKIELNENLTQNINYDHKIVENVDFGNVSKQDASLDDSSLREEPLKSKELEDVASESQEKKELQTDIYEHENKQNEDTETGLSDHKAKSVVENQIKEDLITAKEEVSAEIIDETNQTKTVVGQQIKEDLLTAKEEVSVEIIDETNQNKQDWSWRGNKAVEVDKEGDISEEEEEESEVETETEYKDAQSWEKLKEQSETSGNQDEGIKGSLSEDEFWEQNEDEKSEDKEELKKVRKSVRWDEGITDEDSESEAEWSQREAKDLAEVSEDQKDEEPSEVSEVEEDVRVQEDVPTEDLPDSVGALEDRLEAEERQPELQSESKEPVVEEEAPLEVNEAILEVQGQPPLEPVEGLADGESRLEGKEGEVERRVEGDVVPLEEDSHLEEEAAVNRESRLEEGQEFPEEDVLLPETPPSVHTEEDLWMYLKENVSSVHPSTVEEFVQNLIGTLQHVPEEYLKPVIDANIRRVTSPSLTDGEHLATQEDGETVKEDCLATNQESLESDNLASSVDPDVRRPSGEDFSASTEEVPSEFPGGTSVLQATD